MTRVQFIMLYYGISGFLLGLGAATLFYVRIIDGYRKIAGLR